MIVHGGDVWQAGEELGITALTSIRAACRPVRGNGLREMQPTPDS